MPPPLLQHRQSVSSGDAIHVKEASRYRRMRKNTIMAVSAACLLPLITVTAVNYYLYKRSFQTASIQPILSVTALSKRSLESFLTERLAAAKYVVSRERPSDLLIQKNVESIFERMKTSFGGLVDVGIVDMSGTMRTYVGPYALLGKDYRHQEWFEGIRQRDVYVSDVFLGHRHSPHFVIAVRKQDEHDKPLILRATIDTDEIERQIKVSGAKLHGDAFLVSRRGTLETSSHLFGKTLRPFPLRLPSFLNDAAAVETAVFRGRSYLMGYAPIRDTRFIFVVLIDRDSLFKEWTAYEGEMLALLLLCVPAILLIVVSVTKRWVRRIEEADHRREAALQAAAQAGRMASIGQLAAGVAHEINNPLAIINEKAGLIEDLLSLGPDSDERKKMLKQTDAIVRSVTRCSNITHRLLGLARTSEPKLESFKLKETLDEVLGFLEKEAAYRAIHVEMEGVDALPEITSDKSRLQQLFLNLVSNAFDAMEKGGRLKILAAYPVDGLISVAVCDNGCGIEKALLKKVFEPFFTTKKSQGTGLGLSISYGIVEQLGGDISVTSAPGQGATFTVLLPLRPAS